MFVLCWAFKSRLTFQYHSKTDRKKKKIAIINAIKIKGIMIASMLKNVIKTPPRVLLRRGAMLDKEV
jgi:hypothetical protein